ncbi:hypothetical protein M9Y10_032243 [Tritrichomonas musculus]|uniref:Uncharacterized protein n=1 Tax=Tritrichomonas musculus TaxID=1915356 RepID=A0ABR2GZE4_9EUKA
MINGKNLSYDHGYVNGFQIRNTGRYGLMNYVNETEHKDCYLSLKPLHGTQHINFCWSPGSLQDYTHPDIWKGDRIITGIATAYCVSGLA